MSLLKQLVNHMSLRDKSQNSIPLYSSAARRGI